MKKILAYIVLFLLCAPSVWSQNNYPDAAKKIIDKLKKEMPFQLEDEEMKNNQPLQVIDFNEAGSTKKGGLIYASAIMKSNKAGRCNLGLGYSLPLKIWINGKPVFENKESKKYEFNEIAYSVFTFRDTVAVELNSGSNNITIASEKNESAVIYLKDLNGSVQQLSIKYLPVNNKIKNAAYPWIYILPKAEGEINSTDEIAKQIANIYVNKGCADTDSSFTVIYSEKKIIKKIKTLPESIFKKESFLEWNYPNGILFSSIKYYAENVDTAYYKLVKDYCRFIKNNETLFGEQYFNCHSLRGSNYRMFRKGMLDDAGAPSLPFADIALLDKDNSYDSLLNVMTEFIMYKQFRLHDSTFCRPEPEEWTVWADDLFMSVPLLLKMGRLKDDNKYYNEAARQIINFNKYLRDAKSGLYKHGWFNTQKKQSAAFWGRANGWAIWAESEAIERLPRDNKSYNAIVDIYKKHLEGILSYQGKNYMWHQVLTDTASFEESSCTAMFIIGICRGIINGIVDRKDAVKAFNAWSALQGKIDAGGIVYDICCGTGIGDTEEFYKKRERYPNDPRGLGAIITAAVELDRLQKYLK